MTSVTIPSSVTSIGESAFYNCSSLTNITFGENSQLTGIGSFAFSGCSSLTSIVIPNNVTSIGDHAFNYSNSLIIYCETQSKPSEWNNSWKYEIKLVVWNYLEHGITEIGMEWCLTQDGVMMITRYSGEAVEVVVPSMINGYNVTDISSRAFYDCNSLECIEIPSSVTNIGSYTFYNCSSLTIYCKAENQPSEWTSGWNCDRPVVWNCNEYGKTEHGLKWCLAQDGTIMITGYSGEAREVAIPSAINGNNVTIIISRAFSGCSNFTSIEIPSSITSIGADAFRGCVSLTIYCEAQNKPNGWDSKWNGDNVNYKGQPVVWNCKNSDIADDGYIYYVADNGIRYALKNEKATVVRQLKSLSGDIILPNLVTYKGVSYSVTSIGSDAFYGCSSLTSIEIPSGVTSIGSGAFSDCDSLKYNEYSNAVYLGNKENLYHILIEAKDKDITICTINANAKVIYRDAFSRCNSLRSIVIPNGVISIGHYAFSRCTSLTSIEIPSSVTSIGYDAFYNCTSLTSIKIPSSVTDIGISAFRNCSSLKSIELSSSLTNISNYIFSGCSSLMSITIPNNVTTIQVNAFEGCSSLTSINIPSNVRYIGKDAFSGCSNLASVTFEITANWYRSTSSSSLSGTSMKVTNSTTNAVNLTSTYSSYYWRRR